MLDAWERLGAAAVAQEADHFSSKGFQCFEDLAKKRSPAVYSTPNGVPNLKLCRDRLPGDGLPLRCVARRVKVNYDLEAEASKAAPGTGRAQSWEFVGNKFDDAAFDQELGVCLGLDEWCTR